MESFLDKLKVLKSLDLLEDQYLIWGSGPLAIRKLREARDIDIVVTKKLWVELAKKHPIVGSKKNLIRIDDIEIWSDLLNLTDRLESIIADREIIEGFPFMKLSYTLEWKRFWNSKKDSKDIELIENYLEKKKL